MGKDLEQIVEQGNDIEQKKKGLLAPYIKTIGLVEVTAWLCSYVVSSGVDSSSENLGYVIMAGDYIGATIGAIIQHVVTNRDKYYDKENKGIRWKKVIKDSAKVTLANIPICAATYLGVWYLNTTEYVYRITESKLISATTQWAETAAIWHSMNFPTYAYIQEKEKVKGFIRTLSTYLNKGYDKITDYFRR